jgi:hypothetical protein
MDADGCKPNEPLCFQEDEGDCQHVISSKDVIDGFNDFLDTYDEFRNAHGLSGSISNVHEIIASMTDKLGRIARYVKHQERNDPKPDWPEGMTTEIAGLLVYMIILKNFYNVDISKGMKIELEKAIEQHSDK